MRNTTLPILVALAVGVLCGRLLPGRSPKAAGVRLDVASETKAGRKPLQHRTPSGFAPMRPDTLHQDQEDEPLDVELGSDAATWATKFANLRSFREREQFLALLVETFGRNQPLEVLNFLASLPASRLRNAALEHTLTVLAESDPKTALELVGNYLQGFDALNTVLSIAEIWAQKKPEEALQWASQNINGQQRTTLLEKMVASIAQDNPSRARELVAQLGLQGSDAQIATRALAGIWAQKDPAAALQWARDQSQQSGSAEALVSAYLEWATQDPASVAARLQREGDTRLTALSPEIAGLWAENDPTQAALWAQNLHDASLRHEALTEIANRWTEIDPSGAFNWALTLPESERNELLKVVMTRWSRTDVEAFQNKLAGITPDLRQLLAQLIDHNAPQTTANEDRR